MKKLLVSVFAITFAINLKAEVVMEDINYTQDGTVMKGVIAYDSSMKGQRPGILVVHEWWGHNNYARKRARMLAEQGYTALAVDMYGNGKQASHPEDAGQFSSAVAGNLPLAKSRFEAAENILKKHKTVDPDKIAAIGYCFGGGVVLQMARMGVDLDAVVSFHGSLATTIPAKKDMIKARVRVFNGEADPFVKPEQIEAFKSEMKNANVDFDFVNYPDAKHSFTNQDADSYGKKFNLPLAYNKKADEDSWSKTLSLFKETFK